MRIFKENFYVVCFILIIFFVPIIGFFKKDKLFSDYENRILEQKPAFSLESFFDKEFQSKFEDYLKDQIILKNNLVKIKNYSEIMLGKFSVNDVYIGKNDFYIERHSKKDYDYDLIDSNINIVNKFKDNYNAEIYLIPNASTILGKNIRYGDDINANSILEDIDNISFVDNLLFSYNGNLNDLYYKTDHHWTTIGAYQLYKNIVDNPIDLDLKIVSNDFHGTINNKLNINMSADTIYVQNSSTNFKVIYDLSEESSSLYSEKYLDKKDKYSYFLDSNHGLINIENLDINDNHRILIIKDSYANCLIPFLAESYKYVDVIDLRYFNVKISSYLKNLDYDRILIIYNKDGFMTNTNLVKLQ